MAGNYRLIGEDLALALSIGGTFDGSIDPSGNVSGAATVPAGTTFLGLSGLAKRVGIKSSLDKTNVKGLGEQDKANRYHSREATLELDTFLTTNGAKVGQGAVGHYIIVEHSPLSSMATPFTYVGIITEWDYDASAGTEQSVKITIDLNPDFVPAGV